MQKDLYKRGPCIIGGESEALGFHQETMKDPIEQTETTEDSTDISGLVLYQTLFYLLEKITTSFSYNTKFKIQDDIFNVSGNIVK